MDKIPFNPLIKDEFPKKLIRKKWSQKEIIRIISSEIENKNSRLSRILDNKINGG